MGWIPRKIATRLQKLKREFPVLGILGPRQSGKTTLAKEIFQNYKYLNLEELDIRRFALEDPRRFLQAFDAEEGVILDEIQRAPDLLSYIQGQVDANPRPGFFVLTGSENILLNHHVGQTLSGRIALVTLLPLSIAELNEASLLPATTEEMLLYGGYPALYARPVEPREWIQSYIQTYIERDVRHLKQIADLTTFQKFLQLCAGRIGQLLDLTSIGNDCGITAHTVRSWLSILEATYVIFLLHPYFKNFSKRLLKTPKLYFYDTAVACQLLSIPSARDLSMHYLRGGLFESMILSDLLKRRYNEGMSWNLYFWRDKSGVEIDCIVEQGTNLVPIEVKSAETFSSDFFANLTKWNRLAGNDPAKSYVIYSGRERQARAQGTGLGWRQIESLPL